MKTHPPLTYIRSFESAARHLSFTRAAQELGLTQAAVSSHVRSLEQHVGRQLFTRYPRSLKLTDMGEAYLPTLRQALQQIDEATEAIVTEARSRTVTIACPVSLAENWLASVLARFSLQNPQIEVVLRGIVWEDHEDAPADLTIHVRRYDQQPPGSELLWRDELVLLAAPSIGRLSGPQDALAHHWITVLGRQEYWSAMADAIGLDASARGARLTTNSTNIALELAAEGGGLIATQLSLAQIYLKRGLLVEALPARAEAAWAYYLSDTSPLKGRHRQQVRSWILDSARLV
ncbi:LysR family transcriptional regulator [Frigidibacter sp. MR17.14]|uniref:LysR family transcriptional regulator n=1 Tax=Frigidibacter sp. MR17.14 TaxID=3126509 RepID=UPI003012EBAD